MGFIQMKLPKRIRVKIADTKRKRDAQARTQGLAGISRT